MKLLVVHYEVSYVLVVVIDMMWLYLCVDAADELEIDERWQQYWRDNGQQLVWNDWLKKYPEFNDSYTDDNHHSAAELADTDTDVVLTCHSSVNTDGLGNETAMSCLNGQTGCVDTTNLECLPSDSCENHMETNKLSADGSISTVNVSNTENNSDILAADISKYVTANDVSGEQVIVTDRAEASDGVHEQSSWDDLWEQHNTDTYWFYYDWFVQWLNEERLMQQTDSHSAQHTDDVQQLATEISHLHDELSPLSHSTNCVETGQESLDIVECVLSELVLSVVDSVDHPCPADGNGRKQRRKNRKPRECGLFGISH